MSAPPLRRGKPADRSVRCKPARALTAIGFDADDTLWQNEQFYRLTEERFAGLLAGYVEPDPVVELVGPGQTVTVERVNVREFQIITYVCKTADQSLYASTVDDAGNVVQTLVDVPQALADKGVTAAELCGLAANLGGKTAGSHPLTVDIPVNQVP